MDSIFARLEGWTTPLTSLRCRSCLGGIHRDEHRQWKLFILVRRDNRTIRGEAVMIGIYRHDVLVTGDVPKGPDFFMIFLQVDRRFSAEPLKNFYDGNRYETTAGSSDPVDPGVSSQDPWTSIRVSVASLIPIFSFFPRSLPFELFSR